MIIAAIQPIREILNMWSVLAIAFLFQAFDSQEFRFPVKADGEIIVANAKFQSSNLTGDRLKDALNAPRLSVSIENKTTIPWKSVTIDYDLEMSCAEGAKNISGNFSLSFANWKFNPKTSGTIPLGESLRECTVQSLKIDLRQATNQKWRFEAKTGKLIDLYVEQQAEEKARQKQLAAERAQLRAVCIVIYSETADKKVSDLTVKEEQQVRTCQALNMYPPD